MSSETTADHESGAPADASVEPPPLQPPSPFAHPEWAVGVVLIFGVVSLVLGIVGHPVWLLLGSPFILTLVVWAGVKMTLWRRRQAPPAPADIDPDAATRD